MVERNDTNVQSNRMNKDAKCYKAVDERVDVAVHIPAMGVPRNTSDDSSDSVASVVAPDPSFKYRYNWTGTEKIEIFLVFGNDEKTENFSPIRIGGGLAERGLLRRICPVHHAGHELVRLYRFLQLHTAAMFSYRLPFCNLSCDNNLYGLIWRNVVAIHAWRLSRSGNGGGLGLMVGES